MGLSLAPQDSVCCAVQHSDSSKIKVLLCHQNLADIVDWYSSMINFLESVCVCPSFQTYFACRCVVSLLFVAILKRYRKQEYYILAFKNHNTDIDGCKYLWL